MRPSEYNVGIQQQKTKLDLQPQALKMADQLIKFDRETNVTSTKRASNNSTIFMFTISIETSNDEMVQYYERFSSKPQSSLTMFHSQSRSQCTIE